MLCGSAGPNDVDLYNHETCPQVEHDWRPYHPEVSNSSVNEQGHRVVAMPRSELRPIGVNLSTLNAYRTERMHELAGANSGRRVPRRG